MNLTKVQKRAYEKLTNNWQSARTLNERMPTLDALVDMGLVERNYNPDSHFVINVATKYRLTQQPVVLCANDITDILVRSFPKWTWTVRHGSLTFTIVVKSGIVSYILAVACADLQSKSDVKQAGREAIVGLKDALRHHKEVMKEANVC